jgi:AcrR family transcriptional regulator
MKEAGPRAYVQRARAESAAATADRIVGAVIEAFSETGTLPTLETVAERAGVTVQTVLRRFGSKQGLYEVAASRARARIAAERDAAPVGDVEGAIENLLDHYERWGDVALRMLAAEAQVPASEPGSASEGRAFHRRWVERVFSPWLDELTGAAREQRVDQLVAVTDVYVWKLLARDLERSRRRIKATLVDLVTRTLG